MSKSEWSLQFFGNWAWNDPYDYATYSVHFNSLITLSTLLTNYASVDYVGHPPVLANVCKGSIWLEHSHTWYIYTATTVST